MEPPMEPPDGLFVQLVFNMVTESNCKDLHADLCSNHSLLDQNMVVTSNEMEDIIKELSYKLCCPRFRQVSS